MYPLSIPNPTNTPMLSAGLRTSSITPRLSPLPSPERSATAFRPVQF